MGKCAELVQPLEIAGRVFQRRGHQGHADQRLNLNLGGDILGEIMIGRQHHYHRAREERLRPEPAIQQSTKIRIDPQMNLPWSAVLGKKIQYTGENMNAFEEQMRQKAPSWSAFDIRMMFQVYLERGFIAGDRDLETLTALLGHAPRRYEDIAKETVLEWKRAH